MSQILNYTYSIDNGYKIDLPEALLESLISNHSSPFVFKLKSITSDRSVYVGVREFSAPPEEIGISEQIATDLKLEYGESVAIEAVDIPKGTSITLKSRSEEPVDYKSLLESWLPKTYTALSPGMVLHVQYLGKLHELEVVNLEPQEPAVCIVDCDMDLILETENSNNTRVVSSDPSEINPEPIIVFDIPVSIPGSEPRLLSAETPLGVDKLYISTTSDTHPVFIGPENATSPSSYIAVTDSKPISVLTALLGPRFSVLGADSILISTSDHSGSESTTASSSTDSLCPHCGKAVPQQSLLLHSSFCARNSAKCDSCSRVFSGQRQVPKSHVILHEINNGFESEVECDDCHKFSTTQPSAMAFHKATVCPSKLHICQFCHLLLPQEHTSPVDEAQGLTGHEAVCGTRTTDCYVCQKPVRLRNLAVHLTEHDARRRARKAPIMCANQNCPNVFTDSSHQSPFGLCAHCFGPLSVPGQNADMGKISQRIERRLVLQLMRGCGKSWCLNEYCPIGTGGTKKWTAADAVRTAKELIAENNFSFCVDEISTRKQMFVKLGGEFAQGWRGLAINTCGSEYEATQWLEKNANRIDEQ